jgi:hypothetical protein
VKRQLALILSLGCAAASGLEPYQKLPTVDELDAAIAREGAREVLWKGLRPADDGKVFDALIEKIRSGETRWLQLAARLRPVSEAAASERLDSAVGDALPRAPGRVLRIAEPGAAPGSFSIASICSGRFLLREDSAPENARRWYENSERALMGFRSAALESKRIACLAEVKRGHHRFLVP